MKILEKIRFKIARFLDKGEKHCWADLALFGMGFYPLRNLTRAAGYSCKKISLTDPCEICYCGKFCKGRLSTNDDFKKVNNGPETDKAPF